MAFADASTDEVRVALAQITPVWLDRTKTLAKVHEAIREAAQQSAQLVVFGEALVPGYPWWLERTDAARWDHPLQKEIHAHYMDQAVCIEDGHLDSVCALARQLSIAVVLGTIERPKDRGGHSLYCTAVTIDARGTIASAHRKLCPTYEERLAWSPGDGNGLVVHPLGRFTYGTLNCFENWMPLSRAALYAQGEDLHIALWPGNLRNTEDITRFIAQESRSFVISVSSTMHADDIPDDIPKAAEIKAHSSGSFANGGSCVAGPDGRWVLEPIVGREAVVVVVLNHQRVREERQNFDLAGHYSRPDVTRLVVNRKRQTLLELE
ncbi:hydrolase, carbon-nitrogen family protein [Polychytrium aggregatum]|uniref:hydrolase, carbon-nitrogen family protein n=1 Tax=Polychytrium aggregatum TaxID=110093 RepID=UPI0022FDD787|nr:hydrolase, carbon-nitrogen family protein [Polychytrium aggregatum]KAI9190695.1 hydrolase, carbon-nitrogen family protein [Polychytrium aggregatum]